MDPRQHQLAADFALDKRRYVYKSGEPDPKGEEGCSIVEATQALACRTSVALSVQAKREIGGLWADTDAAPYIDLFNSTLTATGLWRAVQVLRIVDDRLHGLRRSVSPRADMVSIHMNRIILHLVYQDPQVKRADRDNAEAGSVSTATENAVARIFPRVCQILEAKFPGDYLASLCKNTPKCEEVVAAFDAPLETRPQQMTFPGIE